MASVWGCSRKEKKPRKVVGHLAMDSAQAALGKIVAQFVNHYSTHIGAVIVPKSVSQIEVHIMRGKDVVAHFWIEPMSPPSMPVGGDIYRMKGAK